MVSHLNSKRKMGGLPVYQNRLFELIIDPLWKEAQQEVRQHWFIDSYIAAYIQMQYRVGGVHPLV
jgi:hypothetical protein